MPTWTSMTNRSAGDTITEADWDAYQGNIEYLLDPNTDTANYNAGGVYTTTSSSFANVDGTNLSLTVETHGGPVLVTFSGVVTTPASGTVCAVAFDIAVDGVRFASSNTNGLITKGNLTQSQTNPVSLAILVTGLAAGSHTFALQWKRAYGDITPQLESSTATNPVTLVAVEI